MMRVLQWCWLLSLAFLYIHGQDAPEDDSNLIGDLVNTVVEPANDSESEQEKKDGAQDEPASEAEESIQEVAEEVTAGEVESKDVGDEADQAEQQEGGSDATESADDSESEQEKKDAVQDEPASETEESIQEVVEDVTAGEVESKDVGDEAGQVEKQEGELDATESESEGVLKGGEISDEEQAEATSDQVEDQKVPEGPEEAEQLDATEAQDDEVRGIDTVSLSDPEGNWLFKRIWWEKSKKLFGKIRDRVDKIVESRMHFFNERVKLNRNIVDPFYIEIGFNQGALQESIEYLMQALEYEREREGLLDEKELERYNSLMEEKDAIAGLSTLAESVSQTDAALDQALSKLMEQINRARSYERDAWNLFNKIAEELSDKKAREHYYAIATLWTNVKNIGSYIQGPFAEHFMQVASSVIQNTERIKEAIARLRSRGISLEKEIAIETDVVDQVDIDELSTEDEQEVFEQPPLGWFDWFAQMPSLLFKKLRSWIPF